MKKFFKWSGIIVGAFFALLLAVLAVMYLHWRTLAAQPLVGADGKPLPGSVSEMRSLALGGVAQTIYLKGVDQTKPVVLFLHGGPGSPEAMAIMHYNAALQKDYVVVNWDQRGAGKSYSPFIAKESMTVRQLMADTIELSEYLRKRFKKEKIYLVGHSWGSLLGVLTIRERPDLFHAYIGVGQVVDLVENERLSYAWVLGEAHKRGDAKAVADLASIKDYFLPENYALTKLMTQRQYLMKYGGVLHGRDDYALLYSYDTGSEFSWFDLLPYGLGSITSLTALWPQLLRAESLEKTAVDFALPVYLFTGAHDYNVPFELTRRYYDRIRAPKKEMVWFNQSGHMPNFEEPERFMRELRARFR